MKTMVSKYDGICTDCGKPIARGQTIKWFGRGRGVAHQYCFAPNGTEPKHDAIVAPCWICKAPEGRFRSYGAATPVYCDACEAKERVKTLDYKLRHQAGGSAEDYPCSDLGYEEACERACGPGL